MSAEFNVLTTSRYGPFLYNRFDAYVGRSIEIYGEFSELEIEILRQLCGPGSTVFDLGANIGVHTVALAQHVGEAGFVYAFEPQRVVFQTLCANVALNHLLNVECVHAALGSQRGVVHIPDLDYRTPANYGGISPTLFAAGREVRQIVLDEYTDLQQRVGLVKMDVEGMEAEVLAGGRAFFARHRPILYVENDRIEKSEALIKAILALDYRLYWHLPPIFNPANVRGVSKDWFDGTVSINMLCVPRETPATIDGFEEIVDPAYHPFRR